MTLERVIKVSIYNNYDDDHNNNNNNNNNMLVIDIKALRFAIVHTRMGFYVFIQPVVLLYTNNVQSSVSPFQLLSE
jgi:hypothetical protein